MEGAAQHRNTGPDKLLDLIIALHENTGFCVLLLLGGELLVIIIIIIIEFV